MVQEGGRAWGFMKTLDVSSICNLFIQQWRMIHSTLIPLVNMQFGCGISKLSVCLMSSCMLGANGRCMRWQRRSLKTMTQKLESLCKVIKVVKSWSFSWLSLFISSIKHSFICLHCYLEFLIFIIYIMGLWFFFIYGKFVPLINSVGCFFSGFQLLYYCGVGVSHLV